MYKVNLPIAKSTKVDLEQLRRFTFSYVLPKRPLKMLFLDANKNKTGNCAALSKYYRLSVVLRKYQCAI